MRRRGLSEAINAPDRAMAKRAFNAMLEMGEIAIAGIEAIRRGGTLRASMTGIGQERTSKVQGQEPSTDLCVKAHDPQA